MRLIIEKTEDGSLYAYRESERRYRANEKDRSTPRIKVDLLDWECDLSRYDPFHMVLELKTVKRR